MKLIKKYMNSKIQDAKRGKPKFLLTVDEVIQKLDEAGITISDVGRRSHEYQLGRYGDTGEYTVDNCRFITRRENLVEQDHYKQWSSPGNEERRKQLGQNGAKNFRKMTPEKRSEVAKLGALAAKKVLQKKWTLDGKTYLGQSEMEQNTGLSKYLFKKQGGKIT